jgi:glycosyltransferase involved in cell wall biosynthesis
MLGELPPDELAEWMARASIYALPARYEPFGLSVLEAALAGCALVLGDLPSLREVWEQAAVYVPPGDPGALQHALAALIRDPLLRGVLAASARARAARFTPACMAEAYRALYDELCGDEEAREVCA